MKPGFEPRDLEPGHCLIGAGTLEYRGLVWTPSSALGGGGWCVTLGSFSDAS